MTFHAGLYRRRMPLGSALIFALFLALGLVLAPQMAQAAIGEIEAGNSLPGTEEARLPKAQIQTAAPMVLAGNKNKYKNWNKHWSKNYKYKNKHYNYKKNYKHVNKTYKYTKKVYVQPWAPRQYYGEFFGGIVLGSVLTAAAIGVAPPPPAPELCWYWMDPYQSRGYWDYCPPY